MRTENIHNTSRKLLIFIYVHGFKSTLKFKKNSKSIAFKKYNTVQNKTHFGHYLKHTQISMLMFSDFNLEVKW